MPVLTGPRAPRAPAFMQREGAANPEAKAILDAAIAKADIDAKVAEKMRLATTPYESHDDDLQEARQLVSDAATRAKVAEAMIPLGITRRPDTQSIVVTDTARSNAALALKDDKQGIGFNTETLLAYAAPLAVGAGIGALVGSKYAPAKKKVGPYYGAGIGAAVGLAAFAAIQQFRSVRK